MTGVPAWSADGTEIAFNRHVGDDSAAYYGEIGVYSVSDDALRSVFYGTDPNWSPSFGDDTLVADLHTGTTTASGLERVYTEDAGVNPSAISPQPTLPQYSPDGFYVAYLAGGDIQVTNVLTSSDTSFFDSVGASGVTGFAWFPAIDAIDAISYVGTGGAGCNLYASYLSNGVPGTPSPLIQDLGCGSLFAYSPDGNSLAFSDGSAIYAVDLNSLSFPPQESSLTPYLTASSTVAGLGWTPDSNYLVYSMLTPNSFAPAQGQITLTFLPYVLDGTVDTTDARTMTTVGQTFAISP